MNFSFASALDACFVRANGTFVLKLDVDKAFIRRLLTQVFLLMYRSRTSASIGISSAALSQIYTILWTKVHSEDLLEVELLVA